MNLIKQLLHSLGRRYISLICVNEARAQRFSHHNERTIEYRFALEALTQHRPKTVLDVGTGTTAWPRLLNGCGYTVTAIDNVKDYWPQGMVNRHWHVRDVDICDSKALSAVAERFQAITCISVLEHIEDHETAVSNMLSLLEPSGILILTCPYNHDEFRPNVYALPDALYGKNNPFICRSYSQAERRGWLARGATLERRELWQVFSGTVWATGQYVEWKEARDESAPHQLGCFVLRKTAK